MIFCHIPLPEYWYALVDGKLLSGKTREKICCSFHNSGMFQAMKEGVIACAGLDVTEKEPLPLDSPLYELDNVILTPHTAASTEQSIIRCCETAANDIMAVLEGRAPKYQFNKF
ncbi:MAG: hypothetical protein II263_01265, partial [Lachnospiraceae bacterium]|nr:hypothetical protein [Lachnospiraceae bacterium]